MYTISDAERAYYLALSESGGEPMQLSSHGWEDTDRHNVFAYRDGDGFKTVQVTFLDSEGNARVRFRAGDPIDVCLFSNEEQDTFAVTS